ncbi:hypothetical protein ACVWW2_008595 [Bradyrhizobium sp. LM4.3]
MAGRRVQRPRRSTLTRFLMTLPAAAISFVFSSAPAFADLKICNRMSYVVEAAIGIDDKAATATRGWFRIDPATCRVVVQGTLSADRILLNARALGVYGASTDPPERQRHAVRRAGQFRHCGRAAVPQRPDPGRLHPDHADARRGRQSRRLSRGGFRI